MSKRKINRDPALERKTQYKELENAGEAQAALWQALEMLSNQGINIGPKADVVINKRALIKSQVPK